MQIFPLIDPYAIHQDGTVPLTADWDVGAHKITTDQLDSKILSVTGPDQATADTDALDVLTIVGGQGGDSGGGTTAGKGSDINHTGGQGGGATNGGDVEADGGDLTYLGGKGGQGFNAIIAGNGGDVVHQGGQGGDGDSVSGTDNGDGGDVFLICGDKGTASDVADGDYGRVVIRRGAVESIIFNDGDNGYLTIAGYTKIGSSDAPTCELDVDGDAKVSGNLTIENTDVTDPAPFLNFNHDANSDARMILKSQNGSADKRFYFEWQDYLSATKWLMGKNLTNDFILYDNPNGSHRLLAYDGAETYFQSAGSGAVIINGLADDHPGTGGLEVWSGGNPTPVKWCDIVDGKIDLYQAADGAGLTIYGYDNQSAATAKLSVTSGGETFFQSSAQFNIISGAEVKITTAANKDIWLTVGDTSGNEYVNIRDSDLTVVSRFDSNGGALFTDKVRFTQTDGNEYIDSLADGYMDYRATTAHRFGDGTNETQISATGDLSFKGDATTFNDIFFPMTNGKLTGANNPDYTTAVAGNIYEYNFAINDKIDLGSAEISHSYKEGSDFEVHCHLITNGLDNADKYVRYSVEYIIADDGEVVVTGTLNSLDLEIPANTTDRTHLYFNIGTITGTNYKIGGFIKMRFTRIALDGGGDPPTADPFITMVGVHIEEDTVGSKTKLEK